MAFVLHPIRGVNDIEFGMTADMVGARMPGVPEIGDFRATSIDNPAYCYDDVPVFFYFDEGGCLDSIEFCRGSEIDLYGVNPFNFTVCQALELMQRIDPDTVIDGEGAISHKFSLAIWCPNLGDEEDEEPVETVLIGKPGFYEMLYGQPVSDR